MPRLGLGFFVEQQLQATDWLRVIAGLRYDRADFDVDSDLDANSGSAEDSIVSPKPSLVFGPWADTEFFVNYRPRLSRERRARHDHHGRSGRRRHRRRRV